jgi:hypothetical protein
METRYYPFSAMEQAMKVHEVILRKMKGRLKQIGGCRLPTRVFLKLPVGFDNEKSGTRPWS